MNTGQLNTTNLVRRDGESLVIALPTLPEIAPPPKRKPLLEQAVMTLREAKESALGWLFPMTPSQQMGRQMLEVHDWLREAHGCGNLLVSWIDGAADDLRCHLKYLEFLKPLGVQVTELEFEWDREHLNEERIARLTTEIAGKLWKSGDRMLMSFTGAGSGPIHSELLPAIGDAVVTMIAVNQMDITQLHRQMKTWRDEFRKIAEWVVALHTGVREAELQLSVLTVAETTVATFMALERALRIATSSDAVKTADDYRFAMLKDGPAERPDISVIRVELESQARQNCGLLAKPPEGQTDET